MGNPATVLKEICEASGVEADEPSFKAVEEYCDQEVAEPNILTEEEGHQLLVELEERDRLSQKMSDRVRIQRWPGPMGPVVGPSLIIFDLQKTAESLAISGFMQPWIVEQIKAHLLDGKTFTNRGQVLGDTEQALVSNGHVLAMPVRSEYRMATEQEVLDYVDHAEFANITGHRVSARSQEKGYILHYHEGAQLIAAYDNLPRQAKVILDLLNDAGRDNFTEASIEVVLTQHIEALKTRQEPMKLWGFYRRRFIDEGHIEEVDD